MKIHLDKGCYGPYITIDDKEVYAENNDTTEKESAKKELMVKAINKLLSELDNGITYNVLNDIIEQVQSEAFNEYHCDECGDYNYEKEIEV